MPADLALPVDRLAIADGGPFVALQSRLGLLEANATAAPRRAAVFVAPVPLVLEGSTRLPFAELWKIARKLLLL